MDFRHPHFAEPGWLWLAVLSPVCVVLLHRYAASARDKQLARFAAPGMLPDLLRSHNPALRALKNLLLVAAIAAMGIALARPQWGETTEVSQALGEDILFVLDCSKSMLSADLPPSRLNRAKYAILDFVQQHGRGRVGLVAFAGQAFLQCPLTFDYDAFRDSLLACDEKTIPVPGTDIGRALDETFRAMEKNDRRKVIVLVTDGEDLAGSGVTTARALADKGIVVYAVGVGTTAGSPIHIINAQGLPDVLRDSDGRPVVSHLDEATLTQIAQATHGSYHPLGPLGEGLDHVRRLVENNSDSHDAAVVRKLGVERFHFPVALALVLLIVESLTGTRRRPRTGHTENS
jgi:Ca-activated chloride channel family protein